MSQDERQASKVVEMANRKTKHLPEGFSFGESGLSYLDPHNENASPVWICSKLEITAMTRDHNGENWGACLSSMTRKTV